MSTTRLPHHNYSYPCPYPLTMTTVALTCGMMVSLERRSCNPMSAMSSPSMIIFPWVASMMRNKARVREDFPAPVRPTMPIWESNRETKILNISDRLLCHSGTPENGISCVIKKIDDLTSIVFLFTKKR